MNTKESLERFCGLAWALVENELKEIGERVESVDLVSPPFPTEPIGDLFVIALQPGSAGWKVLVTYENYRSTHRAPRSMAPWQKLTDDA